VTDHWLASLIGSLHHHHHLLLLLLLLLPPPPRLNKVAVDSLT